MADAVCGAPTRLDIMKADRVKCIRCASLTLPTTARKHFGLCLRCFCSRPRRISPTFIFVDYEGVTFALPADKFLAALEAASGMGGPTHPNKAELEAQRALIRHAISIPLNRKLHDDLWNTTSEVAARLFEAGTGTLLTPDVEYRFDEINRTCWEAGGDPFMRRGGYVYSTRDGQEILRRQTWLS